MAPRDDQRDHIMAGSFCHPAIKNDSGEVL